MNFLEEQISGLITKFNLLYDENKSLKEKIYRKNLLIKHLKKILNSQKEIK